YVARLERLNKELEDFAFIASHHLQEPLRKIHTFGDKLKARCKSFTDPEARDCVIRMQKSADRMRSLVYDLLRYSRVTLEVETFVPTDLSVVLRHVLAGMDESIEQGRATVEVSPLPVVDVDERQMHELFRELIGNAIKFQGESAPVIQIGAEVHRNPDERPYCAIRVRDNGIGFDERQVERIFAPFQQLHAHDSYEGTGMGLAICRKIVERHNGTLTAKSVPGSGTTFTIVLPLRQDVREFIEKEAA
ncbi:MAG: sensor histidine kinase, partial [Acidobacteriota bacterium]